MIGILIAYIATAILYARWWLVYDWSHAAPDKLDLLCLFGIAFGAGYAVKSMIGVRIRVYGDRWVTTSTTTTVTETVAVAPDGTSTPMPTPEPTIQP